MRVVGLTNKSADSHTILLILSESIDSTLFVSNLLILENIFRLSLSRQFLEGCFWLVGESADFVVNQMIEF